MRTMVLALKDIRQVLRDRRSLIFLLAMPMLFTFFFGFMFTNQQNQPDDRLKIGIRNEDTDGVLSGALVDLLAASDTVRPEIVVNAQMDALDSQVLADNLAAGLIIPPGFSDATLNGESPKLEMVINEETPNGQTARRALETSITRVLGMAVTARESLRVYEAKAGGQDSPIRTAYLNDAAARAAEAWKNTPLSIRVSGTSQEPAPEPANPYNQYSPGMMVMFAIFGLTSAAMVMTVERRMGVMARLLTTPMRKVELIGGHILGMFIVFFVQQLLLVVFGQVFLKVNYFSQPLATLLVMVSLSLWVASLGLLIATLSKKDDQVVLYAMVAMFAFSALGGAWFSLEMVGETFAAIGHLTPAAWAIDGFQNIIARGLGLESVLLPVGILLAYSAAFFGIAIWKFRFE